MCEFRFLYSPVTPRATDYHNTDNPGDVFTDDSTNLLSSVSHHAVIRRIPTSTDCTNPKYLKAENAAKRCGRLQVAQCCCLACLFHEFTYLRASLVCVYASPHFY